MNELAFSDRRASEQLDMISGRSFIKTLSLKRKPIPEKEDLKLKYSTTLILYFCAFIYGIACYIYASSLIDLKEIMNTSIEKISLIFPIVCISFTTGSLFSGFLFNSFDRHLCSIILVFLMGFSVALTPHSPNMYFLYSMAVLKGLSSGAFNNAQIVWTIDIWNKKSGPFLQALQFFVSIGSFITPLMNKPFLIDCSVQLTENYNNQLHINSVFVGNLSENVTQNHSDLSLNENFIISNNDSFTLNDSLFSINELFFEGLNTTENVTEVISENPNPFVIQNTNYCIMNSMISIPYAIEGFLGICGSMLLIILYISMRQKRKNAKSRKESNDSSESEENALSKSSWSRIFYITSGYVMLGSFFGIEVANFQILATFTRYLNEDITGPDSALLLAAFGGAFTIFRGLSIMIAIKIKPQFMLLFNFTLIIIANLLFIKFGDSIQMIIAACVILGTGLSSALPSLYSFLEQFIHVNNTIGSLYSFSGGLMAAIYTLTIGKFIDKVPLLLVYINLGSISVTTITFALIWSSKYFFDSENITHDKKEKQNLEEYDLEECVLRNPKLNFNS